eukprot:TRINITY_DN4143_c0_g1_i5.p1 TRINITY_DN4143_c0_g1~~TRINITY_DN4143_c0_g1_i5.p1  ORF type:complete len:120 (+),score=5.48 TRINITY_DN4143_c0_g1_i5:440-799(+)
MRKSLREFKFQLEMFNGFVGLDSCGLLWIRLKKVMVLKWRLPYQEWEQSIECLQHCSGNKALYGALKLPLFSGFCHCVVCSVWWSKALYHCLFFFSVVLVSINCNDPESGALRIPCRDL